MLRVHAVGAVGAVQVAARSMQSQACGPPSGRQRRCEVTGPSRTLSILRSPKPFGDSSRWACTNGPAGSFVHLHDLGWALQAREIPVLSPSAPLSRRVHSLLSGLLSYSEHGSFPCKHARFCEGPWTRYRVVLQPCAVFSAMSAFPVPYVSMHSLRMFSQCDLAVRADDHV